MPQSYTHPSTDLLMLCESGFVMDVRGHQVKLVLFCQNPQQQDNCPTSTLANSVVDHLTWEWQLLEIQTLKYIVIRRKRKKKKEGCTNIEILANSDRHNQFYL